MKHIVEVTRYQPFAAVLTNAVEAGLTAAALVDRNGHAVGLAGAIGEDEAMPFAALVMHRLKADDLAERMFAGEVISLEREDGDGLVAVAIARRQLFVVATLPSLDQLDLVRQLRDAVAGMIEDEPLSLPWNGGAGGSGSGPAELPVIEWGVTVGRQRGKA